MIPHYPLSWWIERIKTPISLARFGDGEFLCLEGKQGGNSHGCAYTPELRQDLQACAENESILHGLQRILPVQFAYLRPFFEGWIDTEIFSDEFLDGNMKPFYDALRSLDLCIVSSIEKKELAEKWGAKFIEAPRTNAHAESERILTDCTREYQPGMTFLFACGMASGTFVHKLHGKLVGASLIDIGHLLDPFCGELSREYMVSMPVENLNRNLA